MVDMVEAPELLSTMDSDGPSTVDSECVWCERLQVIVPGLFAVAIGALFLYIGFDLITNGSLTSLITGAPDD